MKNQVFAVSLLMAASGLQFANASDGTIAFTGAITAETCLVAINGATASGTSSITLPTVSNTGMTSGVTKGSTALNFNITGCTGGTSAGATVFFEANPTYVDATYGTLKNTDVPGPGTSNVTLQINNASGVKVTPGVFPLPATFTTFTGGAALVPYTVQYVSNGAQATPGSYHGSVTYSIAYQ